MSVRDDIRALADEYARQLKEKIDERVGDMDSDDKSHCVLFRSDSLGSAACRCAMIVHMDWPAKKAHPWTDG